MVQGRGGLGLRPLLRAMQQAQDLDQLLILEHAIDEDERGTVDNEFARSINPAGPSKFREVAETSTLRLYLVQYIQRRGRIPLRDVGNGVSEISVRGRKPLDNHVERPLDRSRISRRISSMSA